MRGDWEVCVCVCVGGGGHLVNFQNCICKGAYTQRLRHLLKLLIDANAPYIELYT